MLLRNELFSYSAGAMSKNFFHFGLVISSLMSFISQSVQTGLCL